LILGREFPGKEIDMTSSEVRQSRATAIDLSGVSAALWLAGTVFLALLVLYFIGIDQGATSIFGSDTHVHEFVHDARHLLGFPCH
jgi:Probable cobalt transporter subunit (CbtB)